MLWVLAHTCRMFRNFARRMIFEDVSVSMHPGLLGKDADILSRDHIAHHVKILRLYNYDEGDDEGDLFKEAAPPKFLEYRPGGFGETLFSDGTEADGIRCLQIQEFT